MNSTTAMIELPPATRNGAGTGPIQGSTPDDRPRAVRRRLPDECRSVTHRFSIGGHKGYITVGLYPNGEPGELFITMAKEGSSVSGFVSCFAQVVSVALQHAVPLEVFCDKLTYTRFEPSGFTGNPEIPIATSIMDYIFRWLRLRFLGKADVPALQPGDVLPNAPPVNGGVANEQGSEAQSSDAPLCARCGALTRRNGSSCFICGNCGSSTGCG